jgi:hypothetical protein
MCGFWSNDPYTSLLKSFGYNAVRLPRANIKPLQVLSKNGGDASYFGELTTVFRPRENNDTPIPKTIDNTPAANISGQKSGDLSVGLGLSILGNIITAMGGSALGLDSKYQQARTVSFQYQDVLQDLVETAALDKFLGQADINTSATTAANLLEADEVFITTSTIKSKKLTIYAKASKGADTQVDVHTIQGIVGSNVKVSTHSQDSSAITFEGPTPLVFGFQAVQLFYDRGQYFSLKPLKTDKAMRGKRSLITEAPFVRLDGYK